MVNRKEEWTRFFTWLRNGICFVTTWLLLLLLVFGRAEQIERQTLCYLVTAAAGGSLLFCLAFTRTLIRKWGFTARFTLFMVSVVGFELIFAKLAYDAYYSERLSAFVGGMPDPIPTGTWLVFGLICLAMYGISMGIYAVYRRKQGELYTTALQKYQRNSGKQE